jgi:alpha-beta hydrolase superfamily lysophospholipase
MTVETYRVPVTESQSMTLDWYPSSAAARVAVFIHGLGSHRRGEKAVHFAHRFNAQGWAFAALDLRGHGQSDGAVRDLTMSGMLADLGATLSWLAQQNVAERPVLIGASMGAAVIAWYALEYSREVGPLAMIAPSLQFPGRLASQLGLAAMQEWERIGVRKWQSPWIDLEIGFGLMEDALKYDSNRLAAEHRSPTFIVHGMRDEAVDWRTSLEFMLHCGYPHIDLVLLKDGDHRLTEHKVFLFDALWAWLHRR